MSESHPEKRDHAVVLGGSIAGLFAARVLSDHFQRVTIIERDPVNDQPESRKGQPQTRHLHGLLAPARHFILTRLGDTEQKLLAGGAQVGDWGAEVRWFHFDDYKIQTHIGFDGMTMSRPFLEWHVRRSVTALPNVQLLAETAAEELLTNADCTRVTGVRINRRTGQATMEATLEDMAADLVVDASGRGSSTPKWLTRLGYDTPEEQEVKIGVGYGTRLYRREQGQLTGANVLAVSPTPPHGKRGAFLFPIEGDRWIVTAGGYLGDHPPQDEVGFMEYIRSLPSPDIYEVLCRAEPLSEVMTYNFPASRRRRYDKLKRFPEGLLIVGDAVASFNPIYGQGMSSAAMQAEALDELLSKPSLTGAWRSFFRRTAQVVDIPWTLAVGEDFRYPAAEGKRPLGTNLINRYVALVHRATHHDAVVYHAFLKVMHLLAPPYSLLSPPIVWRVLRARLFRH